MRRDIWDKDNEFKRQREVVGDKQVDNRNLQYKLEMEQALKRV